MTQAAQTQKKFNRSLIFGLVNGPLVYSLHFLIVYFVVEGGCKSGLVHDQLFGSNWVTVSIVVLTIIGAAAALFGGYVSYRGWRRSHNDPDHREDAYSHFMGVAGMLLNGYFTLLILLTGLPVLLLEMCTWT